MVLSLGAASALAQGAIKLGMVGEFSGPFAQYGQQILGGMKAYMKANGDTIAGKKIEIVQKDTTAVLRKNSIAGFRMSMRMKAMA
jgi:branched-chain amino acid transport system substrate-binding protein